MKINYKCGLQVWAKTGVHGIIGDTISIFVQKCCMILNII